MKFEKSFYHFEDRKSNLNLYQQCNIFSRQAQANQTNYLRFIIIGIIFQMLGTFPFHYLRLY